MDQDNTDILNWIIKLIFLVIQAHIIIWIKYSI